MASPDPLQGDMPFGQERVPLNVIRYFWRLGRDFGPSGAVSTQRLSPLVKAAFIRVSLGAESGSTRSNYWPVFLEFEPMKQSADQNLQKIELEPDEFPFARLSRPRLVDRVPLGWALVLMLLAFTLIVSGKYLLEPTSL